MTAPAHRLMLAAAVDGFAAFVIAQVLDDAMPQRLVNLQRLVEQGKLHPSRVRQVSAQWALIREAGRQWRECEAAAGDSTADPVAAAPAGLPEIDTASAAGLLGVSANRVRQLVRDGSLPGRKVSGSWLVDRSAIEIRREINRGHFR